MKYELAKLFGDVDDSFVEGVKPEAQSAVVLKPTRRSPLKILAAASCAAVVFAGGFATANLVNKYSSVFDDGSKTASLLPNNSGESDNWFDEEQIYYEGEYYKVIPKLAKNYADHVSTKNDDARYDVDAIAGLKVSKYTIEIVAVLKNNSNKPVGIKSFGYDSVVDMQLVTLGTTVPAEGNDPIAPCYRPVEVILQPGEEVYQKETFHGYNGTDYEGEITFSPTNIDPADNHNINLTCSESFHIIAGNTGFKDMSMNWFCDKTIYGDGTIYYEGNYYYVPGDMRIIGENGEEDPKKLNVTAFAAARASSKTTAEVVVVLKNNSTEPIGIRCYDSSSLTEISYEPRSDTDPDIGESHKNDMSDKPLGVILQPGEECYQMAVFDAGVGEYNAEVRFAFETVGSGEGSGGQYSILFEDTFHEPLNS